MKPTEGIYRNPRFMNASNTILGCPVILKCKSNETFHGIFVTFSPEFDVLLESCHKIDPQNEVVIYGRSLPKKSEVHARYFERESVVEMIACDVDKDFALKSKSVFFILELFILNFTLF
jgi:small nuclear ribonucleoprotein (snRNP)-like protein